MIDIEAKLNTEFPRQTDGLQSVLVHRPCKAVGWSINFLADNMRSKSQLLTTLAQQYQIELAHIHIIEDYVYIFSNLPSIHIDNMS
ncbi:hypothetical protein M8J75_005680 [Diaphorina citri]|nr:hypothetical protein M8J75_005680 [Diaphorina citri]